VAEHNKHRFSRRSVLQIAGGVAAAGTVGGVAISLSGGDSADAAQSGASPSPSASAAESVFAHPGMLHNAGDLNRAKVRVAARREPRRAGSG
jgi:hypothetical protein